MKRCLELLSMFAVGHRLARQYNLWRRRWKPVRRERSHQLAWVWHAPQSRHELNLTATRAVLLHPLPTPCAPSPSLSFTSQSPVTRLDMQHIHKRS